MLNRYSYVRNSPLTYVEPTGMYLDEIVPQSPFPSLGGAATAAIGAVLLETIDCALNGDCASAGLSQATARVGMQHASFWVEYYLEDPTHDLFWRMVDLILEGKMTEERMALIPPVGWEITACNWRVTPGFLRASWFDIANGTTVKTSELGAIDIVGAYPWWYYGDPVASSRAMLLGKKHGFNWIANGQEVETVLAYMTIFLWGLLGPNPPTPLHWSVWQTAELLGIDRGEANIPLNDLPYRSGGPDRQP